MIEISTMHVAKLTRILQLYMYRVHAKEDQISNSLFSTKVEVS